MMICAQSGTPRRGAGMDVSVMNSPTRRERQLPSPVCYFCFFSSSSSRAMYGSWIGFAFGSVSTARASSWGWLHPHLKAAEEQERAQKNGNCRDQVGGQSIWRFCQHPNAILCDEILFDLFLTLAFRQHRADQITPLAARFRRADVERRIFADRTVHLLGDAIYVVVCGSGTLGGIGRGMSPRAMAMNIATSNL